MGSWITRVVAVVVGLARLTSSSGIARMQLSWACRVVESRVTVMRWSLDDEIHMKQSYCWLVFLVDLLAADLDFDRTGLRRAGIAKRVQ